MTIYFEVDDSSTERVFTTERFFMTTLDIAKELSSRPERSAVEGPAVVLV
jgi:hypothetical protein